MHSGNGNGLQDLPPWNPFGAAVFVIDPGNGANIAMITHQKIERHPQIPKPAGLLVLLVYAMSHPHSRQWIPVLRRLLAREEASHGHP
jgi:hypothetical protein